MHFERARVTEHPGKNLEGRAAYNGIFYDTDALVLEDALDWVELELDLLLAHILCRVDEGAAHIVVTEQSDFEADAAGLRIT